MVRKYVINSRDRVIGSYEYVKRLNNVGLYGWECKSPNYIHLGVFL